MGLFGRAAHTTHPVTAIEEARANTQAVTGRPWSTYRGRADITVTATSCVTSSASAGAPLM